MAKRFLTPPQIINLSSDPVSGSSGEIYFNNEDSVIKVYDGESWIQVGQGGSSGGVTSLYGTENQINVSASTGSITISLPSVINVGISGNSATASKLFTERAISLSGDISGTVNFDGSASVDISTTLANSGVSASTYGSSYEIPILTIDSKGRITSASATSANVFPSQDGQSGKFLSTDGSTVSWSEAGSGSGGAAYQPEEPDSPSIGDLWVESDEEYVTINPNDYALKTSLDNSIDEIEIYIQNSIDEIMGDYTQMLFLGGM
jgi:hypothetical protein